MPATRFTGRNRLSQDKIKYLKQISSLTPRWDLLAGEKGVFHLLEGSVQVFEPCKNGDTTLTASGWWLRVKEFKFDVFLQGEELEFHSEFEWKQLVRSQRGDTDA